MTRRSLDEPQTHLSPQSATAQTADHGRRRSRRRASAWSRSSCHSRRAAGGLVLEPVRAAGNRQTATHSARRGSRSALRGRAGCATSRRSSLFPLGDSRRSRSPRAGSRCARPCRPRRVASVHGLRPFGNRGLLPFAKRPRGGHRPSRRTSTPHVRDAPEETAAIRRRRSPERRGNAGRATGRESGPRMHRQHRRRPSRHGARPYPIPRPGKGCSACSGGRSGIPPSSSSVRREPRPALGGDVLGVADEVRSARVRRPWPPPRARSWCRTAAVPPSRYRMRRASACPGWCPATRSSARGPWPPRSLTSSVMGRHRPCTTPTQLWLWRVERRASPGRRSNASSAVSSFRRVRPVRKGAGGRYTTLKATPAASRRFTTFPSLQCRTFSHHSGRSSVAKAARLALSLCAR